MNPEHEVEKIKDKINKRVIFVGPDAFVISRMASNVQTRFKKFASMEEFSADYGNAIAFLLNYYEGIIPNGIAELKVEIEVLRQQIAEIAAKIPKEQEKKAHTTLDGRRIVTVA